MDSQFASYVLINNMLGYINSALVAKKAQTAISHTDEMELRVLNHLIDQLCAAIDMIDSSVLALDNLSPILSTPRFSEKAFIPTVVDMAPEPAFICESATDEGCHMLDYDASEKGLGVSVHKRYDLFAAHCPSERIRDGALTKPIIPVPTCPDLENPRSLPRHDAMSRLPRLRKVRTSNRAEDESATKDVIPLSPSTSSYWGEDEEPEQVIILDEYFAACQVRSPIQSTYSLSEDDEELEEIDDRLDD